MIWGRSRLYVTYKPTREGGVLNLVLINSPDLTADSRVSLVCLTNATLRILSAADTCPSSGQAQLKRCQELPGYERRQQFHVAPAHITRK